MLSQSSHGFLVIQAFLGMRMQTCIAKATNSDRKLHHFHDMQELDPEASSGGLATTVGPVCHRKNYTRNDSNSEQANRVS